MRYLIASNDIIVTALQAIVDRLWDILRLWKVLWKRRLILYLVLCSFSWWYFAIIRCWKMRNASGTKCILPVILPYLGQFNYPADLRVLGWGGVASFYTLFCCGGEIAGVFPVLWCCPLAGMEVKSALCWKGGWGSTWLSEVGGWEGGLLLCVGLLTCPAMLISCQ